MHPLISTFTPCLPGTGKTRVIVELILQFLRSCPSIRILVSADSNAAVNVIATRMAASNVPVLRVGHPARLPPEIRNLCPEARQVNSSRKGEVFTGVQVVLTTLTQCAQPRYLGGTFQILVLDEVGQAKVIF